MRRWLKQNRSMLAFVLGFGFFRLAIADWNPIPSGSMRPTLLEGDVVLVNRLAYDFKVPLTNLSLLKTGEPQRGDVITFTSPQDGVRLIKRLVALPGDLVEMREEVLYINGQPAQYLGVSSAAQDLVGGVKEPVLLAREQNLGANHAVQFLPQVRAMRSFPATRVPPGSYFFLGDNRDNSADSRYIGVVPREMLIGKAHHILVSANILGNWLPRFDRLGQAIE